ncbi:MAG: asparagine synthase (glutamine-hydrolyzing) [bacterium]
MCGIAGIYGQNNNLLLDSFSKNLIRRGPDEEGRYLDNSISMLIRRLSIIDLNGGSQPKFSENKQIVVTFNGEIYNFKKLSDQLVNLGHKIVSKSDTEIIAHAYEQWGTNAFNKFDGMFSIAIYDKIEDKLILVRDQFGIKPLYYTNLKNTKNLQLIYSSEIKPLIYSGLVEALPDDKTIYRYLKFRVHDDNQNTFFKNIYRLLPGEMLTIKDNKVHKEIYSNLNTLSMYRYNDNGKNKEELTVKFKKILKKSVNDRLISDVPVGTCLSGGLDSSTVVALVNNFKTQKTKESNSIGPRQNTFSAIFPGFSNDEEKYVDELSKRYKNLLVNKIHLNFNEFQKDLKDFIKTQEEPTISTGPYAQYKVFQEAKKHVKVVLDGQGADEMLAGYNPYFFVYFQQLFKQRKYFLLIKESVLSFDVIIRSFAQKNKFNIKNLLSSSFCNSYKNLKFKVTSDNLKKRLYEDIFKNSLQALLRYEDKNSMRFSIEGRVPFCQKDLVNLIFSLPDNQIINNGNNKAILRNSFKNILPKLIRNRRNKIGFTTPEYEWFKNNFKFIEKIFLSESFGQRKYFSQTHVMSYLKEFVKGNITDTLVLWRLANVELWLREFIDKKEEKVKYPIIQHILKLKEGKKNFNVYIFKTKKYKPNKKFINNLSNDFIEANQQIPKKQSGNKNKWFAVISEKVIAVSQGRSYFLWDIKPRLSAKILSKFVNKNPSGIGLRSPWTMELAIKEVGLVKIVFASVLSAFTKMFGFKGIFYKILGRKIASIDGPTEYSIYPSNVSAKLGPLNPQDTAEKITKQMRTKLNNDDNFMGIVIIDANDLGQDVLGNSTTIKNKIVEKIFKNNPMGQTNEQTPLSLVFL